jgi:hypothetical protein
MERKKKKLKPRNDGDRNTHAAGRCGGNGEAGGEKLAWTIGPRRTRVTRWMDMLSLSSLFGGFIELHGPSMLSHADHAMSIGSTTVSIPADRQHKILYLLCTVLRPLIPLPGASHRSYCYSSSRLMRRLLLMLLVDCASSCQTSDGRCHAAPHSFPASGRQSERRL